MLIEWAFIVFTLESGFGWWAFDAHPPQEVDWNRIATEFIVYSLNNDKITHGYAPMNSNIVEAFASRPPYTLYLPSKIRTLMAYHAGTLLTRCCRKKWLLTKWSCVVLRNLRSTLSTTSDKARQIIGWTLVCVLIHLECWLDKARAEIVTWTAVDVVCQQPFSYNLVSKFWQCERDRCESNSHSMRIGWMWIQFAFKQDQVWKGLKIVR